MTINHVDIEDRNRKSLPPTHSCRQHEDRTIRNKNNLRSQSKPIIKRLNFKKSSPCKLQGLRKKIRYHRLGGTILNGHVAGFHLVCDEEITNVKRTCLFAGTPFTVDFQKNRALAILEHSVQQYLASAHEFTRVMAY